MPLKPELGVSDGLLKKAIANNTKLADYSHMRAGGMVANGSLLPKSKGGCAIESFQKQVYRKSKGS